MKKYILVFLLILPIVPLFSNSESKTLSIYLDLAGTVSSIEKMGFSTSVPNLDDSSNLPTSTETLRMTINNDEGIVEEAKFYIWWYLYSETKYKLECKVTPFMGIGDVTNTIDFVTTAVGNSGNTEGITSVNNKVVNVLGEYTPAQGLYSGYIEYTINPFSYVNLSADSYMATVTVNLISTT